MSNIPTPQASPQPPASVGITPAGSAWPSPERDTAEHSHGPRAGRDGAKSPAEKLVAAQLHDGPRVGQAVHVRDDRLGLASSRHRRQRAGSATTRQSSPGPCRMHEGGRR